MASEKAERAADGSPSSASTGGVDSVSNRRRETLSPWTAGKVDTRTSKRRPPVSAVNRPSCGVRRSERSSLAMTFSRATTERRRAEAPEGRGTASSSPSTRMRMANSRPHGSTWMSVAPSPAALESNPSTSFAAEASSPASSSMSTSGGARSSFPSSLAAATPNLAAKAESRAGAETITHVGRMPKAARAQASAEASGAQVVASVTPSAQLSGKAWSEERNASGATDAGS